MARKLFALEAQNEQDQEDGELLIDKVLKRQDKTKPGLAITSELIKQRHELKQEIQKEIAETTEPQEQGEDSPSEEDNGGDNGDTDKSQGDSDEGADDKADGDDSDQGEDASDSGGDKKDEQDEVEVATDKDSLSSMVGSGLGGGDKPAKKEATESFKQAKAAVKTEPLFASVAKRHQSYMLALEGLRELPEPIKPKAQPVVYVKQDVLKGLDAIITMSGTYISKNTKKLQEVKEGVLKLAESMTIYKEYNDAGKLKLSMKVLEDQDLLKSLCSPGVSSFKTLAGSLDKYMGVLSGCLVKLSENDISSVKTVLSTSGFTAKEDSLVFDKILPGFTKVSATAVDYTDYLSVKFEDYQFYSTKSFQVQDLYNIGGVSLDSDNNLKIALKSVDGIIVHAGLFIDNLVDVNAMYNELIVAVKAMHHDVSTDKIKNLAQLDIDSHLKEFIKFKMLSEGYTVCSDICIAFLSAGSSALSQLVVLADGSGASEQSSESN